MTIRGIALASLCIALGACATTTSKPPPQAQIEIQDQVGFTITEPVTVSASVRTDYERALVLLEQGQEAQGIALLESVVENAPDVSGPRIDRSLDRSRSPCVQVLGRE